MPRYREPFTLFPRKLSSGKTVYYYRTYAPDGSRTVAHSTGQSSKAKAKSWCVDLFSKGVLTAGTGISFGTYAKDFFGDNSQWMYDKKQSGAGKEQPVAKKTLFAYRHCNDKMLLPYFSKIKMIDLKPAHIKSFRDNLLKQSFSNSSINLACACLKIILSYAISDRIIAVNPFTSINQMYTNARAKTAFTLQELKKLFHSEWENKERKIYIITAAVTGMRISEIAAIRSETLFRNYIDVKDQYLNKEYIPVKDGERRKVRICEELYIMLSTCIRRNYGIAFKENQDTYRQTLYNKLGLNKEARDKKGLSFHSLRHFFNTYLLNKGIPEIKVKSIMGHSSGKGSMTERYANFLPEHFDDIANLQQELIHLFID